MAKQSKTKRDLVNEINSLGHEIDTILTEKKTDRYFEGIAILHSFIEDLLKWLVSTQIVWNKSQEDKPNPRPWQEIEEVRTYCNQQSLYSLLNLGLTVDLLDFPLYSRLKELRVERNSIVHQYWLYTHKGKRLVLRKKLEKIANIANLLVGKFNDLVEETGMDESYGFFGVSTGRNFVAV